MKQLKLTGARQARFLEALADTGSVTAAVAAARTSRTRVYELRKTDTAFAAAWDEAEEIATDRLEEEARRRAMEGVAKPLVSGGKLVRGDDGQPITVRHYSDNLLLALLNRRRPPRRKRSVRVKLPALRSTADAASAMTAIAAAVATGELTPGEAAELSKVIETYFRVQSPESPRIDVWVAQGNGMAKNQDGKEISYEEARRLAATPGSRAIFASPGDANL